MDIASIFLGFLGGPEIILIVLVILILVGGRKIPELMKGFGKGIKEFKSEAIDDKEEKKTNTPENK